MNNELTNKARLKPLFNELTGEDNANFIIINYQTETADFPDSPQHVQTIDFQTTDFPHSPQHALDHVSTVHFAHFYFVIH